MDVLFILFLAHLFGDYALQSDHVANVKRASLLALTAHVLIYVVCIWGGLAVYSFLYQPGLHLKIGSLVFVAVLFVQHWVQDYLKSRARNQTRQLYYFDQVIHLTMLYLYRIFIYG